MFHFFYNTRTVAFFVLCTVINICTFKGSSITASSNSAVMDVSMCICVEISVYICMYVLCVLYM